MSDLTVSIIVVSRHRPDALRRCLVGISQLYHSNFELIVVSCKSGLAAIEDLGFSDQIKQVSFEDANISIARNLGLSQAAGDVVAFIDDDAVPEPTWLTHLAAPFADRNVTAAGGYVRGRNGITFQSTAQSVDRLGRHTPLTMSGDAPTVFQGTPDRAIKTEGTNCAFRRDTILRIGGFDPEFRFFLDETDLNIRLALTHSQTAIVPLAEVHHGFAPSIQRRQNRMPRTLFDVGASLVVFLRKYALADALESRLAIERDAQFQRLIRHMVAGTCEPQDVGPVMDSFDKGITDGQERVLNEPVKIDPTEFPFQRFDANLVPTDPVVLSGRSWERKGLLTRASNLVKKGQRVSLFLLSPTSLYHHVTFREPGVWIQTGGIFGRSTRNTAVFQLLSFNQRLIREKSRIKKQRGFND